MRYTLDTVRTLVRDFRAGRRGFFVAATPGPKSAPATNAARDRIVDLRTTGGLSIDEITAVLAEEGTPLNRAGISKLLAAEGLPQLWCRRDADRGEPVLVTGYRARGSSTSQRSTTGSTHPPAFSSRCSRP